MEIGKIIKYTGYILGGITIIAGLAACFLSGNAGASLMFLILVLVGVLECVVLAGFGQIVEDVHQIKNTICESSENSDIDDVLPEL